MRVLAHKSGAKGYDYVCVRRQARWWSLAQVVCEELIEEMAHVLVKLCVTYHQLYLVLVVISTLSYDITSNVDIISKLKANQSRFKAYC